MVERGEKFGKYTLLERLAAGGMAEIFKARLDGDSGYQRVVAIKRLHRQFSEDQEFSTMLIDEAKLAVQLRHPNIGEVFDLERIDGQYFIVMEYINGLDLLDLVSNVRAQNRRIPLEALVYTAGHVASALEYAHTKLGPDGAPLEVVHRDVSPQNIMVDVDGVVKLVDFGIAKARMRAQHTRAGVIKGKFYYMSPEQAHGNRVDARSDIYALGMVLYEILTGGHPFETVSDEELLSSVRTADFPNIRDVLPQLPQRMTAIIERALMRNAERRFRTAEQMRRELTEFANAELPRFGQMEMAELIRQHCPGYLPEETRGAGMQALDSGDYRASRHSVIFDSGADAQERIDEFEEGGATRVFMREEDEAAESGVPSTEDLEQGGATEMLDWDTGNYDALEHPPAHAEQGGAREPAGARGARVSIEPEYQQDDHSQQRGAHQPAVATGAHANIQPGQRRDEAGDRQGARVTPRSDGGARSSGGYAARSEGEARSSGGYAARSEVEARSSGGYAARSEGKARSSGGYAARSEGEARSSGGYAARSEGEARSSGGYAARSEGEARSSGGGVGRSSKHSSGGQDFFIDEELGGLKEPEPFVASAGPDRVDKKQERRSATAQIHQRLATGVVERFDRVFRRRPHAVGAGLAALAVVLLGVSAWLVWGPDDDDVADDWHAGIAGEDAASEVDGVITLPVSTTPANARVYLDDELVGQTPVSLDSLEVGQGYVVRFERDGYETKELNLVAEAEMTPRVVRLEPLGGVVQVETDPEGVDIYVDDELQGSAPLTVMGLDRELSHEIEARLSEDESQDQQIQWDEGDERVREIVFEFEVEEEEEEPVARRAPRRTRPSPSRGTTSRGGSGSSSGGSGAGSSQPSPSPEPSGGGSLLAGSTEESGSEDDAEPESGGDAAESGGGGLDIWGIGEQEEQGRLTVRVDADNGRIYVDGNMVKDGTALVGHALDPGSYEVRVYFPDTGQHSDRRRVTVRSGETSTVRMSP